MVNKSFVLKKNFYSRQVFTILSIPWKLPLKGYSIVVIISCFFLLFEVESLQKSNRTWFLDISVSQLLCHTRNNTRDYLSTGYGIVKCSKNHGNNKSMWCFYFERFCFHKFSWKLLSFSQREQSQFQLEMNVYCISWLRQVSEFDCCSCPSNISFKFINCCSPLV